MPGSVHLLIAFVWARLRPEERLSPWVPGTHTGSASYTALALQQCVLFQLSETILVSQDTSHVMTVALLFVHNFPWKSLANSIWLEEEEDSGLFVAPEPLPL